VEYGLLDLRIFQAARAPSWRLGWQHSRSAPTRAASIILPRRNVWRLDDAAELWPDSAHGRDGHFVVARQSSGRWAARRTAADWFFPRLPEPIRKITISLPPEQAKFAYSAAEQPSKPLRIGRIKNAAGANNGDLPVGDGPPRFKVMEAKRRAGGRRPGSGRPFRGSLRAHYSDGMLPRHFGIGESGRCANSKIPWDKSTATPSMEFSSGITCMPTNSKPFCRTHDPVFDRFDVLDGAQRQARPRPSLSKRQSGSVPPRGGAAATGAQSKRSRDGISSLCSLAGRFGALRVQRPIFICLPVSSSWRRTARRSPGARSRKSFQSHTDWHTKPPGIWAEAIDL